MTFSELCQAFTTYTGAVDQVDNAQLALWFNEAQLDLAYDLGLVSTLELEVGAGDCYRPGADWLCITGCELFYQKLPDGRLRFPEGGRGAISFRALPSAFSGADGSAESSLPEPVHYLMAMFAASRYWDMESEGDGEESNHAGKWLSYYYQGKNAAKSRLPGASFDVTGWTVA